MQKIIPYKGQQIIISVQFNVSFKPVHKGKNTFLKDAVYHHWIVGTVNGNQASQSEATEKNISLRITKVEKECMAFIDKDVMPSIKNRNDDKIFKSLHKKGFK